MSGGAHKIELGHEQLAAISTPGNLLLRAGAGSGKTEVLARRFVAFAAGDIADRASLEPTQIAAITFTERAALDMRMRIAKVLNERALTEADTEHRNRLIRAQRLLPLSRISTIHAFCARLLRENAFAANLDPDFEVLDEYESNTFFERICRETLIDAVREQDAAALSLVRTRRLEGGSHKDSAIETIQRIFFEARRKGFDANWIVERTEHTAQQIIARERQISQSAADLKRLIDQLVTDQALGIPHETLDSIRDAWINARPMLDGFTGASEADALEPLRKVYKVLPHASGKPKTLIKQIRELVELKSTTKFGLAGALITAWGERRAVMPARQMAQLLAKVGRAYETAKRDERVLTFDDLLIGTRDLLRNQHDVARRYRDELGAILVDEYQDVDSVQNEIIARLTDPLSDGSAAPELFIVGDEKQSIYRFRGADVSVFNQARGPLTNYLPLSENRRSTPNLLNFINALSAVAMRGDSKHTPAPYEVVWHARHELKPVRSPALDYPVEIITAIDDHDSAETEEASEQKRNVDAKRPLEALALANLIRDLIACGDQIEDPRDGVRRPATWRDVVVLFRAFTDIAIYERIFAEAGIDCYTVKGRGFYHQREVIDLIELLGAIDDPRDSMALAAALRSPFFSISDECLLELGLRLHQQGLNSRRGSLAELFAPREPDFSWLSWERELVGHAAKVIGMLRQARERLPLPELIEYALDLTDYESVIAGTRNGRQRVANLRKLTELAYQFDAHHLFTFHDFVAYLRQLTEQEPYEAQAQTLGEQDNVVRLMTVHQVKGLEFPIVILADAGRQPNVNPASPLLDRELGLVVCATDGSGDDEIPNAAFAECRDRIRAEEAAESVRVLYVAITRARDRLIISEGANRQGWSKPLRELIGAEALASFEGSEDATREINCDGAQVLLRRPDLKKLTPVRSSSDDARNPEQSQLELVKRRLTDLIEETGRLTITPTELADFDRCPRQYWFRHGLGIPENLQLARRGTGNAAALGSVAHAVMERVKLDDKNPPTEAELHRLAQTFAASAGIDTVQCMAVAHDLSRYIGSRSRSESVIGREVPFMINLAPQLFMRGQIDAVVRVGNALMVRDYKYISHPEAEHYQIQMECYTLAVAMVNPGYSVEAELVALRSAPASFRVKLPSLDTIHKRLVSLGHEIAQARGARDFSKKPVSRSLCYELGCGYVARCWKD